jgi:hypothetical protein
MHGMMIHTHGFSLQAVTVECHLGNLGISGSPQKLAITSLTTRGLSVGIVRSRTQTMEFSFFRNKWEDDIKM